MTVLRSRGVRPPKSTPKTLKKKPINIAPATPTQTRESNSHHSPPILIFTGSGADSGSVSRPCRRRSLRIASKSVTDERKTVEKKNGASVSNQEDGQETGFDIVKWVRVLEFSEAIEERGNGSDEIVIEAKGYRKRLSIGANSSGLEDGGDKEVSCLRSGKRIAKRKMDNSGNEGENEKEKGLGVKNGEIMSISTGDVGLEGGLAVVESGSHKRETRRGRGRTRNKKLGKADLDLNGINKMKMDYEFGVSSSIESPVSNDVIESVHRGHNGGDDRKGKRKLNDFDQGVIFGGKLEKPQNSRRKYSAEEKGKRKLIDGCLLSNGDDRVEQGLDSQVQNSLDGVVPDAAHLARSILLKDESDVKKTETRGRMKQFREIARQRASSFAHFNPQEVEEVTEMESPSLEEEKEIEDWPGPFSTAMKIIRDRESKLNAQQGTSFDKIKCPPITWVPKKKQGCDHLKPAVPSLQELCIKFLVKNADAITSLDCVPDGLRHKLSQMLCDSRKMNSHFLDLLLRGSPTELRLRDCSWLTEEQFTKCFEQCDFNNLVVLQLDQCGRCLPDYILLSTLARSTKSLPSLTTLSLGGACRLSDVGLSALVSSSPALRSLNLSQCSLLTSNSICNLADSLGSVLRELYINDCQSIDAMLILPALRRLEHLEVLSLAGIGTICDDFIRGFINARGYNLKELVLADCLKLTDSSLKVIAEHCSNLCALDLVNLCKLTDAALGYLANGCRAIQRLKLCRNTFSDEAVAAFLETSGEFMIELSLNNVRKVGHNTALALARRLRKLLSLDLSWCRNMTDEAVGLIVDSCSSLRVLKLFGCSQVTDLFLDGHSNPEVRIIGLKMSQVLEHVDVPNPLEGPLHYSSVPFQVI